MQRRQAVDVNQSMPIKSPCDSVDRIGSLFSFKFSPHGWHFSQHLGEAPFEGFRRRFPAIYFGQDHANHIDKGLQGCTSLAGFLVAIVGWWKEAVDVINDLITEDEDRSSVAQMVMSLPH
jgi:hypothetical protein